MRFDPAMHRHSAERPAPADHRPYQLAADDGRQLTHHTNTAIVEYRQVGWRGASGALYSLDEDPSRHEPAAYSPLYQCVRNEDRPTTAYRVGYCDGYVDGANRDPQRYLLEPDGDEHPRAYPTVDGIRGHLIREHPSAAGSQPGIFQQVPIERWTDGDARAVPPPAEATRRYIEQQHSRHAPDS